MATVALVDSFTKPLRMLQASMETQVKSTIADILMATEGNFDGMTVDDINLLYYRYVELKRKTKTILQEITESLTKESTISALLGTARSITSQELVLIDSQLKPILFDPEENDYFCQLGQKFSSGDFDEIKIAFKIRVMFLRDVVYPENQALCITIGNILRNVSSRTSLKKEVTERITELKKAEGMISLSSKEWKKLSIEEREDIKRKNSDIKAASSK